MGALRLIGRSSSHYTRLARLFAEEMAVDYAFEVVPNLISDDPQTYGGNPALKLPVLMAGDAAVFGAQNICRALSEFAAIPRRIVWPEDLADLTARNAQELVWHGMQAQVQLALGVQVAGLPPESVYFAKAASGLANVLAWLDDHAPAVLDALPPGDISMFEASLFCLVEHLAFRATMPVDRYPALMAFAQAFGRRPAAQKTPYRFDVA